jgi:hypothetical protein
MIKTPMELSIKASVIWRLDRGLGARSCNTLLLYSWVLKEICLYKGEQHCPQCRCDIFLCFLALVIYLFIYLFTLCSR